jgi:aldehyde:ferredoxin oxidoreductase
MMKTTQKRPAPAPESKKKGRTRKEALAVSSNKVGGYAGKILRVDLTNERITEDVLDEATLRKWVGGVGFGAKYLYDLAPDVQWNDPANRLIVASGPLGGTMVGGSANISFITKGCLTNGATSTQANGFMGAFMKTSGYDAVVFEGIAKQWVYLYIHDNTAELRDARSLIGKNTWETEDEIKAELGYVDRQMSVFCIGPAGENLVKFAGIFGDKDHAAGHNGVGAVMGVKRLKAFCAPLGNQPIKVASPKKLLPAVEAIWQDMLKHPQGKKAFTLGTGGGYGTGEQRVAQGTLPVKNYLTSLFPEHRVMTCQYVRERWKATPRPCWACGARHCHMVTFTDGPYLGLTVEEPEYEMFAAWGPLVGNTDPAETLVMSNLMTLLGMEGNEAGFLTAMVIELYEKGVLTKEDTGGLELKWGNNAAIRTLLERVARQEGAFANILAEGTKSAAEALGEEALKCGIYTMKGHSPRGHDHRAQWREMFDTATSDIGTFSSGYMGPADPDSHSLKDRFSPEDVSTHTAKSKGRRQFEDTLGTCTFCTRVQLHFVVEALNAVTGWDFTPKEAQDVGLRVANLMRSFNLRHGVSVELERPSPRWSSAPADGPAKGVSIVSHWDAMLDNYYRLMGWDRKTGKPLPETLRALGLDSVVADLWN